LTLQTKDPLSLAKVPAGFPSPARDYLDQKLDLNQHLISNPAATFFVRAVGESMLGAGIHPGDLLVVDRSRPPGPETVVVAALDGEFTVKRLRFKGGQTLLCPENPKFSTIEVQDRQGFWVWGVVLHVIHSFGPAGDRNA
jgi:DNA polymerase V